MPAASMPNRVPRIVLPAWPPAANEAPPPPQSFIAHIAALTDVMQVHEQLRTLQPPSPAEHAALDAQHSATKAALRAQVRACQEETRKIERTLAAFVGADARTMRNALRELTDLSEKLDAKKQAAARIETELAQTAAHIEQLTAHARSIPTPATRPAPSAADSAHAATAARAILKESRRITPRVTRQWCERALAHMAPEPATRVTLATLLAQPEVTAALTRELQHLMLRAALHRDGSAAVLDASTHSITQLLAQHMPPSRSPSVLRQHAAGLLITILATLAYALVTRTNMNTAHGDAVDEQPSQSALCAIAVSAFALGTGLELARVLAGVEQKAVTLKDFVDTLLRDLPPHQTPPPVLASASQLAETAASTAAIKCTLRAVIHAPAAAPQVAPAQPTPHEPIRALEAASHAKCESLARKLAEIETLNTRIEDLNARLARLTTTHPEENRLVGTLITRRAQIADARAAEREADARHRRNAAHLKQQAARIAERVEVLQAELAQLHTRPAVREATQLAQTLATRRGLALARERHLALPRAALEARLRDARFTADNGCVVATAPVDLASSYISEAHLHVALMDAIARAPAQIEAVHPAADHFIDHGQPLGVTVRIDDRDRPTSYPATRSLVRYTRNAQGALQVAHIFPTR